MNQADIDNEIDELMGFNHDMEVMREAFAAYNTVEELKIKAVPFNELTECVQDIIEYDRSYRIHPDGTVEIR